MSKYNKERAVQLGMSVGAARNKLHKSILFDLVCKLEQNICFQCGDFINNIDDFSIEHMEPWLHKENSKDLYFDLNNIAFSHLKCNIKSARRLNKIYESDEERNSVQWKRYWDKMSKEEQQKRRRDNYVKYGC